MPSSYATKFRLLGEERKPCPETAANRQSSNVMRRQPLIIIDVAASSYSKCCLPLPLVHDFRLLFMVLNDNDTVASLQVSCNFEAFLKMKTVI